MNATEIASELKRLMEAHGLACATRDDWVLPNGQLPAMRALWHPGKSSGRLDIQVLVEKDVLIEECFAGIGSGEEGFHDALRNFMLNSLHVLLAAFWGKDDPDQVITETWQIAGNSFRAFIGNFGTRASAGYHAHVPHQLFPEIQSAITKQQLGPGLHWIRTFFCSIRGEQTFEALLDNEEWLPGVECLKAIPWEETGGYYSVRNFLVLCAA